MTIEQYKRARNLLEMRYTVDRTSELTNLTEDEVWEIYDSIFDSDGTYTEDDRGNWHRIDTE